MKHILDNLLYNIFYLIKIVCIVTKVWCTILSIYYT